MDVKFAPGVVDGPHRRQNGLHSSLARVGMAVAVMLLLILVAAHV